MSSVFDNGGYIGVSAEYGQYSIVSDGLVLALDASDPASYSGTGTTWFDISGNSNNGVLTNGPTYNNEGSLVFDGTDDYLSIPNSSSLGVGDVLTISSWINASNLLSRYGIFSTRFNNSAGSWQLEVGVANSGTNRVSVTGVGVWIWESSNNVIQPNTWTNICYRRPSNTLFINGIKLTPLVTTSYTIQNNSDIKVLGSGSSSSQYFPGRISNTYLYSRQISDQEIQQNYNALKGRYGL
jgi:hypothetical protein